MSRTPLAPELVRELKTLFGTAPNAYRRLGLQHVLGRSTFNLALSGYAVSKDAAVMIEDRFTKWRSVFLSGARVDPDGLDDAGNPFIPDLPPFTLIEL
jgi:hypothetical protein